MNETVVLPMVIPVLNITIPFTGSLPLDIFFITLFVSLYITLINKYFTDQIAIKALRKEMKDLQKKMRKQMTKNPEKAQVLQKEIMKKNMENFKHLFNPRILMMTMLPILLIFAFIQGYYGPYGKFFNLLGWQVGWLWTYVLFSIINSIILKKVLDVA